MSHNPMIYLGEESISMAKLTNLYLDHMSLQDLSGQALSGAPLLSHLDLGHNQLRYLEPLSGPKELKSLNLTGTTAFWPVSFIQIMNRMSSLIHPDHQSFFFKATRSTVTATCDHWGSGRVRVEWSCWERVLDLLTSQTSRCRPWLLWICAAAAEGRR